MEIPMRETFSRRATRGRSLCRLTNIPLGGVEGEIHLVLLALFFDFLSQDAEHQHVPVIPLQEGRLAENTLQVKSIASQRIGAQQVVFVDLGLDPPKPEYVDTVV